MRVRGREPHTPDPLDHADLTQQLPEERAVRRARNRDVAAVGVDVLTEERDLDHAAPCQSLHLGQDVPDRAGSLRATDERHDAERAGVGRTPVRSRPTRGTGRGARTATRWGRPPCTRGRPSADRPPPTSSAAPTDAAARAFRPRCRPTALAAGSRPGPSAPGTPRPRCGATGRCPSTASDARGCRTGGCPRSHGSRTC